MKSDCCYEMAKDIFVCHLGMTEGEAEKQLATMFQNGKFVSTAHSSREKKLTNYSDNKKV
ncbi:hypothetical protein [Enterovibrio coralii]|uniref:Uncharacterized protein n=1 Tax=Enterovibrio coralii TaxID=294935 RepID=A0A135I819_9GAMM|nr:hypothetical protein [Enterovibrio coralii]KXF81567.1 hypothetical protein ATN88_02465 [Enterovibrio coralii]